MAATRRTAIRTLTIDFDGRDEQVTATPMTDRDLACHTEDIDLLDLPMDRTRNHFSPLKGWDLYDAQGEHFGRVFSRGGVMTAEWYDDLDQQDWLLAEWGCHRLERAAYQILLLRAETTRACRLASEARLTAWEAAKEKESQRQQVWATPALAA